MPRGSISDEKGIDKIGEEGGRGGERGGASAPQPNFCFGPRTLILKKNTWNFLHFFFEPAIFCMNAAPNAMLHNNSLSDEKNTITINAVQ